MGMPEFIMDYFLVAAVCTQFKVGRFWTC